MNGRRKKTYIYILLYIYILFYEGYIPGPSKGCQLSPKVFFSCFFPLGLFHPTSRGYSYNPIYYSGDGGPPWQKPQKRGFHNISLTDNGP